MTLRVYRILAMVVVLVVAARAGCPNPQELPVRTRGSRSMCARFYKGSNREPALSCHGTSVDVANGEAVGVMPCCGWNDEINSVVVRPGCTFRGYADGPFRGQVKSFTGQNHHLRNVRWNDVISSYACTCSFSSIACRPEDQWEVVLECDASQNTDMVTCQHRLQEGTAVGSSVTNGRSMSTTVTATVGAEFEGLFSASLSTSATTEYNWARSSSFTRSVSTTQVITVVAPAGMVTRIYHVVGRCGDTAVYTERFKVITTSADIPVCRDDHSHCGEWASTGECHNNPFFMLTQCRQSCDNCAGQITPVAVYPGEDPNCIERSENCASSASSGECERNPGYMLQFCQRSCNVCPT